MQHLRVLWEIAAFVRAPVTVALLALITGPAVRADVLAEPERALTFIEVRSEAAAACREILRHYARSARRNALLPQVRILQEIARPERFVLLETTDSVGDRTGPEATARHTLARLDSLVTAPPDRRTHRDFDVIAASPAPQPAAPESSAQIYVIAHLDIGPPDRARGEQALDHLAGAARHSAGNLRFDVWRQTDRTNHFNIIGLWSSRARFSEFAASAAAREFRSSVASVLGSPYDDRLYRSSN